MIFRFLKTGNGPFLGCDKSVLPQLSVTPNLRHEASHNLMRHRDEMVFSPMRTMFADYEQAVTNYRKDLANGHSGGVKRYLWQSMKNFSQEIQNAEQ